MYSYMWSVLQIGLCNLVVREQTFKIYIYIFQFLAFEIPKVAETGGLTAPTSHYITILRQISSFNYIKAFLLIVYKIRGKIFKLHSLCESECSAFTAFNFNVYNSPDTQELGPGLTYILWTPGSKATLLENQRHERNF